MTSVTAAAQALPTAHNYFGDEIDCKKQRNSC